MTPRPCRHCGVLFIPRNRFAHGRKYCYKPECHDLEHTRKNGDMAKNLRSFRQRQKRAERKKAKVMGAQRPCRAKESDFVIVGCCGMIDNGNLLYCSFCHKEISKLSSDLDY